MDGKIYNIEIKSMKDILDFNRFISKFDFDIMVISGCYIINAKSIMNLFTLPIGEISIKIYPDDNQIDEFEMGIKNFIP